MIIVSDGTIAALADTFDLAPVRKVQRTRDADFVFFEFLSPVSPSSDS